MRQHGSVFMLVARSTLWKLLLLFLAMAAAETGLFLWSFRQVRGQEVYGLEQVLANSRLPWVWGAALLIMAVLLCWTGCEFGSRQGYTLRRLSVSERAVWAWQAVYNACCFFLLWAVQLFLLLAFSLVFLAQADPAMVTEQTLFLAASRSSFFHSLLPLVEGWLWVRNLLYAVLFGLACASFPYRQRRGKSPLAAPVIVPLILVCFSQALGEGLSSLPGDMAMLVGVGMAVWHVWSPEEVQYEA